MSLLISDANIFIDLQIGDLTDHLFRLPITFAVPDVLYEEELRERHPNLLAKGLQVKSMGGELMVKAEGLILKYPRPSKMDILALTLAMHEQCPLLTGDKALRTAACAEKVEVHGMIWIGKTLLEANVVQPTEIRSAFAKMKAAGSRLPWTELDQMLIKFAMKAHALSSLVSN